MSIDEIDNDIFKLPDTQIAAWLQISGVKYIDTDISEFPALHRCENPKDGTIGRLLQAWEDGRTQGDCKAYYKTYRRLVQKAKEASPLFSD